MQRREFIVLISAAAAGWLRPLAAQGNTKSIGILTFSIPPDPIFEVFLRALRDLGWSAGDTLRTEFRGALTPDQFTEFASEFVRNGVDVIFAPTSVQVEAARQATRTIPIVFAAHGDPVGVGHVASLSHPGGNITGMCNLATELTVKCVEVLRDAIPTATRIGLLANPDNPAHVPAIKAVQATASAMGLQVQIEPARTTEEFDPALSRMAEAHVTAFVVVGSPLTFKDRGRLAQIALKHNLSGVYPSRENVEAGGLISYGADIADLFRGAAGYVDKILRGASPADLPVQQASKFRLVINQKTAKALGIIIAPSLLARADEVIE